MNKERDATSSAMGYDYQFWYAFNCLVDKIMDKENYKYEIGYEDYEDISIYYDGKLDTVIQVKYHGIADEPLQSVYENSGFYKVVKAFYNNFSHLKDVNRIIYSVSSAPSVNIKYSPCSFKECMIGKKNISDLMSTHSYYTNEIDKLKIFCEKVVLEEKVEIKITDVINQICENISMNYLNTYIKDTDYRFKTQYILYWINNYMRDVFFNKDKKPIKIQTLLNKLNEHLTQLVETGGFDTNNALHDVSVKSIINSKTEEEIEFILRQCKLSDAFKMFESFITNPKDTEQIEKCQIIKMILFKIGYEKIHSKYTPDSLYNPAKVSKLLRSLCSILNKGSNSTFKQTNCILLEFSE